MSVLRALTVALAVASCTGCAANAWEQCAQDRRYGCAWVDAQHVLIAGPEFGVAKLALDGRVLERWLGREDLVLDVDMEPGARRCVFSSGRERVCEAGGAIAPELYTLDLGTGAVARLTHDELNDELLRVSGGYAWARSASIQRDAFGTSSSDQHIRRIDLATGDSERVNDAPSWSDDIATRGERFALTRSFEMRTPASDELSEVLALEELDSGTRFDLFHAPIRHGPLRLYDVELSPGERLVSFMERDADWNGAHRLWLVETRSHRATKVWLPLAKPH